MDPGRPEILRGGILNMNQLFWPQFSGLLVLDNILQMIHTLAMKDGWIEMRHNQK